jgi:hypothetical protein
MRAQRRGWVICAYSARARRVLFSGSTGACPLLACLQVQRLMEMGFSREACVQALTLLGGDENAALDALLSS